MLTQLFGSTSSSSNSVKQTQHEELQECKAKLEAISQTQAVIEFEPDGTILTANSLFQQALGYRLNDIVGQHHRIFMPPAERETEAYRQFWSTLRAGEYHAGQFTRVRKDGSDILIQAMYYPIKDESGKVVKVVKYATDISEQAALEQRTAETSDAVAGSIEQMVATISEISGHVTQTASLASTTESEVVSTADSVQKLDESSRTIEKVVELIRSLSEQTNLLALNATIESARAGEAGKGFAVVANEVKELAKQTADATESIDSSVTQIRDLISESVRSTERVTDSIRSVSESMISVAAAVEEQSVTMHSLNETASQLRNG